MAYPTTLNYQPTSPVAGLQPITVTSTTQAHPLGTVIRAVDSNYGEGEFIYLKGVASTTAGDLVVFDAKAGTTTRTVAGTTKTGAIAVAMSANVASQYGWYQVGGEAIVNTTSAGTGAANANLVQTATAGQATVGATGANIISGATCKTAQDTPSSGFTQVQLVGPFLSGLTQTQP